MAKLEKQDDKIVARYTNILYGLLGVTAISIFKPITWKGSLGIIGLMFTIMCIEVVWKTMTNPKSLDLTEAKQKVIDHAKANNIPIKED